MKIPCGVETDRIRLTMKPHGLRIEFKDQILLLNQNETDTLYHYLQETIGGYPPQ